jgi:hypothetical protein
MRHAQLKNNNIKIEEQKYKLIMSFKKEKKKTRVYWHFLFCYDFALER